LTSKYKISNLIIEQILLNLFVSFIRGLLSGRRAVYGRRMVCD